MTRMIIYQYNVVAKIGTISLDNIFKMVPSLEGGLFFLGFIFWLFKPWASLESWNAQMERHIVHTILTMGGFLILYLSWKS